MIDQGDQLQVQGYRLQGVLYARRIVDSNGTVLAQSKCFVATAVFGDPTAPEVETLRRFRSSILETNAFGRRLTALYWRVGPRFASWVERRPGVRWLVRWLLLQPIVWIVCVFLRKRPAEHHSAEHEYEHDTLQGNEKSGNHLCRGETHDGECHT